MSKVLLALIASVFAFNVASAAVAADEHKDGDKAAEQTEEKKEEATEELKS